MSEHVHRFVCGTPVEGITRGVCACGETREYLDQHDTYRALTARFAAVKGGFSRKTPKPS